MGDRSQVAVKMNDSEGSKVYLYSHWGGTSVYFAVQAALSLNERWDDPEYLARMIFCRMVEADLIGATGFGIGTQAHGDIEHLIPVLDCRGKTISFECPEFLRKYRHIPDDWITFEDFLALDEETFSKW